MKQYKILKDIPGFKAGDIIVAPLYTSNPDTIKYFGREINTKEYKDFFEEIIEKKTFDTLTTEDEVWFIRYNGEIYCGDKFTPEYCRSETFVSKEAAEDEHKRREWSNRKDKFIPEEKETYFSYSNDSLNIVKDSNDCYLYDIFVINQGLAFRTEEECQDAIDNHDIVRLFYTIR